MHSSRVGALKVVRASSAYFGLTNSRTAPPEASMHCTYVERLTMMPLVLPG